MIQIYTESIVFSSNLLFETSLKEKISRHMANLVPVNKREEKAFLKTIVLSAYFYF